jgi:hypothetical protein
MAEILKSRIVRNMARALFPALLVPATPAFAAEGIEGAGLGFLWALPFAGLLLCIATGPVLFHRTWEHHYGKIAALWAALTVVPLVVAFGFGAATSTGADGSSTSAATNAPTQPTALARASGFRAGGW